VFFQQASLAQRVNSAVRNISAVASETRGLYQASQNFNGFTEATLINAGAVPSSIINGNALQNEWSGPIVGAAATTTITDDSFTITYENVPTAACVRLVTYDALGSGRVGSGIGLVGFREGNVATGAYASAAITGASNASGITPTEASVYCSAFDNGNATVDIQYTFTR